MIDKTKAIVFNKDELEVLTQLLANYMVSASPLTPLFQKINLAKDELLKATEATPKVATPKSNLSVVD